MRVLLPILFVLSLGYSSAQTQTDLYTSVGLNRIGVLYEIGAIQKIRFHYLSVGIRLYEPDIVFEKDIPGLHLSYTYQFFNYNKFRFNFGAATDVFYEKKQTNKLCLFYPKLFLYKSLYVTNKLRLNFNFAFGKTINRFSVNNTANPKNLSYINYEISMGITYRLGNTCLD